MLAIERMWREKVYAEKLRESQGDLMAIEGSLSGQDKYEVEALDGAIHHLVKAAEHLDRAAAIAGTRDLEHILQSSIDMIRDQKQEAAP